MQHDEQAARGAGDALDNHTPASIEQLSGWARFGLIVLALVLLITASGIALALHDWARSTPVVIQGNQPNIDVAVLRAQLTEAQRFNDRILQVAIWTLASVVTIAVALGVFSWFTNNKQYQSDKDALRQEVRGYVVEQVAGLQERIRSQNDAQERRLLSTVDAARGTLTTSIEERFEEMGKEIRQETADTLTSFRETFVAHQKWITNLLMRSYENEGARWEILGQYEQALRSYSYALGYAVALSDAVQIPFHLEKMRGPIEKGIKPGADVAALVLSVLAGVPTSYQADIDFIREKLAAIRGGQAQNPPPTVVMASVQSSRLPGSATPPVLPNAGFRDSS